MKKIYLIRHAKSSWNDGMLDDFSRPINGRGKKDLQLMGKRLAMFKIEPDIIYSSPAKRAIKTAKSLAESINYKKSKIITADTLYESSYEAYLALIHSIDDDCKEIFIIAHNPTITEVGERLSGAILTNIPTCAIVCIAFDVKHFSAITEESGKILFFDYPKKHTTL
ncbi:MAG: histidine phosphatase family protein [Sulfurospirillaceae bacterium]|nr:histidine phosphatase family protein [Sulfurospirillaceae bacterium]MDD2825974.1 histidine phosphatase family protein [Sulfurospirillaceae bacterium]